MLPSVERKVFRLRRGLWPAAAASLGNFVLGNGVAVDFRVIWDRHRTELSPFCLDLKRNQVVFVRLASDIDLTSFPFYYHAQRVHATKTYSLGLEQYYGLADELDDDAENVGFLFSTGRCGSTLLARLLAASPQVVAISEPDVYTQAALSDYPQDETAKILSATTRLLWAAHRSSAAASFLLVKLRSQCVYRGDIFRRADPRYRNLFLYRNAIDVVNSFYALLPSWGRAVLRYVPVDDWILSTTRAQPVVSRLCPLVSDARFSELPRSSLNILTLMWLSAMEIASRLQEGDDPFFQAILRFEDLVEQRLDAIAPLFEQWRVEQPSAASLEDVFETESQSGSGIASRGLWVLTQKDEDALRSIIALHPHIRTPQYRLNAVN